MSIWTHAYCEIRTPKAMNIEELQKAFGKECLYKWDYDLNLAYEKLHGKEAYEKAIEEISNYNEKLAEAYDKDPKAYLPCGSEGSLSYMRDIWQLHSEDGRFKYIITGNLRDYSDDIGIVKWFRDKFLEWKHGLKDIDENQVYGYVFAGMGAGEFSWQYGPKDIREVGENERTE